MSTRREETTVKYQMSTQFMSVTSLSPVCTELSHQTTQKHRNTNTNVCATTVQSDYSTMYSQVDGSSTTVDRNACASIAVGDCDLWTHELQTVKCLMDLVMSNYDKSH